MSSRSHSIESNSRNKIYRAHMRNMFENHNLQQKMTEMDRGKVSLLESHLRRTLEVKETFRNCRKNSGRSPEALPSNGQTTTETLHTLQNKTTPWSYFGNATIDTWDKIMRSEELSSARPQTADETLTRGHSAGQLPAETNAKADKASAGQASDMHRPRSMGEGRGKPRGTGHQGKPRSSADEPFEGVFRERDDLTLPGTVNSGESSDSDGNDASTIRTKRLNTRPHKISNDSKLNQQTSRQTKSALITQLESSKGNNNIEPKSKIMPEPSRRGVQKSRTSGNTVKRTKKNSKSTTSAISFNSSIASGQRKRLDSDYLGDFVRDDGNESPLPGFESPFTESWNSRRQIHRSGSETEAVKKNASPERRAQLYSILRISETPTSNRGPKVSFDPSVKGPPGRGRRGPKLKVTVDSDSESDVDLAKVERKHGDPRSIFSRRKARRKVSPELQFYVRPQERYHTEHMFIMKRKSMLQRQLNVAKDPTPPQLPGMNDGNSGTQPPIQIQATSSRMARNKALDGMVAENDRAINMAAKQRRLTQCLSLQDKVGAFLKKISSFITAQS